MEYQLIYSDRTTLAIQVTDEGGVIVRAPKKYPRRRINQFVHYKQNWITRKVQKKKAEAWYINAQPLSSEERSEFYEIAGEVFSERAAYYGELMGVCFDKITIMEKRSRWGVSTRKGELKFNWRLLLGPEQVLDYVVIYALAQMLKKEYPLEEVLECMMPDYMEQQRWLEENGIILWSRN